jgi:hypothetical protein
MKISPNTKKVRSVIITTVLVAAANFAISHAESVTSLIRFDGKSADVQLHRNISIASGEIGLPTGPRPQTFIASGEIGLPTGPRPQTFIASGEIGLPTGPRPENL